MGRRQEFQRGAIYVAFQNAIGSAIRNGLIRDKWNTVGAETPGSLLGYPIQDPLDLPDGQGRMSRFERGVIYWHPTTGAHPITGMFLWQYENSGYENGEHGYPTTDETTSPTGVRSQEFQHKKMSTLDLSSVSDPNPGEWGYQFHPNDTTFVGQDEIGKFSGQVDYSQAPSYYPMSWGMRLSPYVESVAAAGGATPAKCEAFRNEDGNSTDYHYDKYSPETIITVDYPMHSTIKFNTIGAAQELYGYCSFDDKWGGISFVDWYFVYTVLDFDA